jgi:Holliday junction resolvase
MAGTRGTRRERQVRELLEADGWIVVRAAGSLGPVDLAALKRGAPPRLVQVKSDQRTPYKNFGPADRARLVELAERAGAEPWLYWWPAGLPLKQRHADDWPPL